MDDFQVVLYIVFGVIYVLSRILKKRKQSQSPNRPMPSSDELEPEVEKPISFEDLLQEITGSKSSQSEQAPSPTVTPTPSPTHNTRQLHYTPKPLTAIEKENEKMRTQGKELKPLVEAKPIHETIHHHDHSKHEGFERLGAFEIEEEVESEFMTFLHEEDGPKKAFVLSEIFNRKY